MKKLLLAAAVALPLGACAQSNILLSDFSAPLGPEDGPDFLIETSTGTEAVVGRFWRIDGCDKPQKTHIQIITQPLNGELRVEEWEGRMTPRMPDYKTCGPIALKGKQLIYTPSNAFVGTDSFRFRRYDKRPTNRADFKHLVSIQVTPPRQFSVETTSQSPVEIWRFWRINGCDAHEPTFIEVTDAPENGAVTVTDWEGEMTPDMKEFAQCGPIALRGKQVEYTPDPGFTGADSFAFRRYDNRPQRPITRGYVANVFVK